MSEDFLRLTSRDEHHFELIKSLGFRSYMTVPLATPTKTLGAVTLVTTLAGRRYSESDLAVAEQFASQITAVIDSARVHETEHRIALTLQRSLLPDQLPDLSGAQVAARYLPGSDDAEVGGDWYDILCLSRDRIGLVAGDVEGHDIEAATVMGQLRNALRAYALDDHDPADTLDRLARFGDRVGLERMATVVFAVLDPQTGELTVASAGHPQPIIVTESGAAFVVAFPSDPPLGVVLAPHRQYTTLLEPRAAVVLYTDGLIEDRAVAVDESIRHLLSAVQAAGTDPERICAAIEQLALGDGGHRDDVAVLVLQRMTDPEPDG
jgi:serine/threonine-protein kinase RsbW